MIEHVRTEPCRRVTTKGADGSPNGFLVELYTDGPKTILYLTAAYPKAFKGYHLHTVRSSHLVCLKGRMEISVVEDAQIVTHVLDGSAPERLFIPANVWIGYENIGNEDAWMVNFPDPPYDPNLAFEQQEKTRSEIAEQLKG